MFTIRQFFKVANLSLLRKPILAAKPISSVTCVQKFYNPSSSSLVNFARNLNVVNNSVVQLRPSLLQVNRENEYFQQRSVTQYSRHSGKRRTVKNVLKRFYRLDWGIWIRTKCGRHKKMYKKSSAQKRRLKEHVFCNASQSKLLDKMVTKFWHKPKYFVDDPYEPYHKREEFLFTRKKPVAKVSDQ